MDAFWINEPARDAVASHKPYQLALAQQIGLDVPPTLMTNDVEEASAFWRRHEGQVIYKQFLALPIAWRETRRLKPEHEAQSGRCRACAGDLPGACGSRRRSPSSPPSLESFSRPPLT